MKTITLSLLFLCLSAHAQQFNGVDYLGNDTISEKNRIHLDVGGVANLVKFSYSRTIDISKNFSLSPRVGISTLGADLIYNKSKRIEVYFSSRALLLWGCIPIGFPINEFYKQFEELEVGSSFFVDFVYSNGVGVNYIFNSLILGGNVGILTRLKQRSNTYGNSVLSIGVSLGYKF